MCVCTRFVCDWVQGQRDTGERRGSGEIRGGVATVPKAIPTQTDTILKLANGLHSVACCPICGPLFSGWYTDAPSEETSQFQRGSGVG